MSQAAHRCQDFGRPALVRRAPSGGFLQHGFDLIARSQGQADQVARNPQRPLAQLIERVFQMMREAGDVVETKHRARSLNSMQRPESPPHHVQIGAVPVELEQRSFQLHQQLARFLLKGLFVLVDHLGLLTPILFSPPPAAAGW